MCKIGKECNKLFDIDMSLWESMGVKDTEYPEDLQYLIVPCTDSLFLPWAALEVLEMNPHGYCTKWGKSYYWETVYDDAFQKDKLINMIEIIRKYHTYNNLEPKFPETDLTEYNKEKLERELKEKAYQQQKQDEINALNAEEIRLENLWQ